MAASSAGASANLIEPAQLQKKKKRKKAGFPPILSWLLTATAGVFGDRRWIYRPFRNAYSDETGRTAEWAMPACIVSSVLRPSNALGDEFSRTLKELRNPKTLSIALCVTHDRGCALNCHGPHSGPALLPPKTPALVCQGVSF